MQKWTDLYVHLCDTNSICLWLSVSVSKTLEWMETEILPADPA